MQHIDFARITVVAFMFLPLVFVDGQEKNKDIVVNISQCCRDISKKDRVTKKRALSELHLLSQNISNIIDQIAEFGLSDRDDDIRHTSALTLANFGPAAHDTIPRLVALLESDKSPRVRSSAAKAIGTIFFRAEIRHHEKLAVSALGRALRQDQDNVVRWVAADALGCLGDGASQAAGYLLDAFLDKSDGKMREVAGGALYAVASPQCKAILPRLIKICEDGIDDDVTAFRVFGAIGRIQSNEKVVIPLLLDAAKKKNPKAPKSRQAAITGLGEFGASSPEVIAFFVEVLEKTGKLQPEDADNLSGSVFYALRMIGPGARVASPALEKIERDVSYPEPTRAAAKAARERIQE